MLAASSVAAVVAKLRRLFKGARNLRDFYALDAADLADLGIDRHDVVGRRVAKREAY